MTITNPRQFGKALCEAVGIDPSNVGSVTLRADARGLPVLTIERYVDDDTAGKVLEVLKRVPAWEEEKAGFGRVKLENKKVGIVIGGVEYLRPADAVESAGAVPPWPTSAEVIKAAKALGVKFTLPVDLSRYESSLKEFGSKIAGLTASRADDEDVTPTAIVGGE